MTNQILTVLSYTFATAAGLCLFGGIAILKGGK